MNQAQYYLGHLASVRTATVAASWLSTKRRHFVAATGFRVRVQPMTVSVQAGPRLVKVMRPAEMLENLADSSYVLVQQALKDLDGAARKWAAGLILARLQQIEERGEVPRHAISGMHGFCNDVQALAPGLRWQALLAARLALEATLMSKRVLAADVAAHPEIAAEELESPIFIVGLPRTGSTLLHHLLSLDPDAQFLKTYELMSPVRSVDMQFPSLQDRLDRFLASIVVAVAKWKNPRWDDHHAVSADAPEECILAIQRDLPRDCMIAIEAVRKQENTPWLSPPSGPEAMAAYESYANMLRHQQALRGTSGKHFVLKGQQVHLRHLEALQAAFPGARVIWTHRDPKDVVSSLCGMRQTQHEAVATAPVDRPRIGRHVLDTLAQAFTAGKTAMDRTQSSASSGSETVHVQYDGLVKDPIGVVENLYTMWGLKLTPQHKEAMQAYLKENEEERRKIQARPNSKSGKAKPHYRQFSITDAGLEDSIMNELNKVFQAGESILAHKELAARVGEQTAV